MSTLITIAEEQRQPLLLDPSPDGNEEEIAASSSSNGPDAPKLTLDDSNQRLLSLDVFRGLTVAKSSSKTLATKKVILRTIKLFLLGLFLQGGYFHGRDNLTYGVDVVKIRWLGVLQSALQIQTACRGSPTVHCLCCPWGLAIGIVFGWAACWPASLSAWPCGVAYLPACCLACLHGWPVSLAPPVQQRGFSSEPSHLVHPRALCMQRISIGYLLASISEIWLVYNVVVDCPTAFVRKYHVQWIVAALLLSFYMCLLYGLYVPNWEFQAPSLNLSTNGSHTQIVHCGVRGSLEPPCNAVGYIDQYFLGEQHLYQRPVYRRTKECSVNSPDYGPLPPDSPEWCLAPFDPEGILSSLMAVLTCFVGLHFGHVLLHYKGQMQRALLWSMSSFLLLVSGFGLEMLVCFVQLMAGRCNRHSSLQTTVHIELYVHHCWSIRLVLNHYLLHNVKHFRKPVVLLQWMGMNALIVYALAACDIFPAAVQGFYWRSPENNLVDGMESLLQAMLHSSKWGTLVFVLLQILFWCLVAGFLHMKGIYIKL
ncbi:PREDICTED: heparan-alpha-glucosaminide N-acetyltransferase isoform X4 [Theobroma cacao]|uniref:Heparan-alpha-glucosaminide N-acetyltransferase isoform X4 n=1 Tax=Theobroma cacao TaxID=3641 RepID=A0AB32VNL5_THECC|nr:PREDICTED: heparan-alpha-glucosaminide N-acetyltransferase isoform X4 [Theobroma cacao]